MSSTKVAWPLASNLIRGNLNAILLASSAVSPTVVREHPKDWDFSAPIGASVHAIADGTVQFIRNGGDYGVQLCLSFTFNGSTYYAFYAHLQRTLVAVGTTTKMKDVIAKSGNSGNARNLPSSEEHLHFEIRATLSPGPGLAGRVSPLKIYGRCPLKVAIPG